MRKRQQSQPTRKKYHGVIKNLKNKIQNLCKIKPSTKDISSVKVINNINKKPINTNSLFQMLEAIQIPGAVETTATPVHTNSTTENVEVQQRVSENTSKEVETDDEDYTPNLMVEIANSLDAMTEAEPDVFTVNESTETVEYEMPGHTHLADNVTEENQDLALEIDLTEGEVLIINEDAVANPAAYDTTEEDDKAENDEVAPATPQSRGRSRKRSCRTRSAPRSTTTRRPGNTASPPLRSNQNSPTLKE